MTLPESKVSLGAGETSFVAPLTVFLNENKRFFFYEKNFAFSFAIDCFFAFDRTVRM